jgi:hypothetical protein
MSSLLDDAIDSNVDLASWASQGYPMSDMLATGLNPDRSYWQNDLSTASSFQPPAVKFKGLPSNDGLIGLHNKYIDASSTADADLDQADTGGWNGNAQQVTAATAAFATDYPDVSHEPQGSRWRSIAWWG